MIVSWNWLKQYVPLDMPLEELQQRLTMAGLNHEQTRELGGDLAIDLEVTSNRPDCLGHLGVAREIAVLFGSQLKLPAANPPEGPIPVEQLVSVRIECPDLCPRYTARVIRGVKVGPSPRWLARRLQTVGITPINNVVDASNYVLMECGQPLHTFDYGRLKGPAIVVRRPRPGETIEAIDHRVYGLLPEMCVIADAQDPVAIGGVMGGAATEICPATTDVLVEAAEFNPVSIRNTARVLNLHSDSSYRFERGVDPAGVDWASRRCCQLILELAGGELARGVVDVGRQPPAPQPITLRLDQLKRILGIEVPPARVREILCALGLRETEPPADVGQLPAAAAEPTPGRSAAPFGQQPCISFVPPSWRRDLTREIDLVEEVGRIYGYDAIPEDVGVAMVASRRPDRDRAMERIRTVLMACGFDEAMTLSVVDEQTAAAFSPWTDAAPLRLQSPVLRGADRLRRSLVPSLLLARRSNEALANPVIELFEIAKVYLPRRGQLPEEPWMLGLTSGRDYAELRGVIEALVEALDPQLELTAETLEMNLLDPAGSCWLKLGHKPVACLGRLRSEALKRFDLRGPAAVAELRLDELFAAARLVRSYVRPAPYPAVSRDVNLVVDDCVRWGELAATIRANAGAWLESLVYRDTYYDAERLGAGKKSLLFTIALRSEEGTLTSQQADELRDRVVVACAQKHGAKLRSF